MMSQFSSGLGKKRGKCVTHIYIDRQKEDEITSTWEGVWTKGIYEFFVLTF